VNGRTLPPVLGRSYELGVKGELLDRRLQLSAAVYRLLQDNVAQAITGSYAPDGSQAYRAVQGAETRGFELEANGALTRDWNLYAGFARNLARDGQSQRLNPEIPRNTFKLFTTYRLAGLGRGLTVGGGARWQSSTWSDYSFLGLPGVSRAEQKSYAVADLMLQMPLTAQLTLSAHLYNVFDKKYQAISTSAYYGEARNLRVSLAMKF
jgi:outer membrane receptor for ferric coprogen and ferric-rhodotorulic acid